MRLAPIRCATFITSLFANCLLNEFAGNRVQFESFALGVRNEEELTLNLKRIDDIPLNVSLKSRVNVSSIKSHWDLRFPKNLVLPNVRCRYRMLMAFIPDMAYDQGPGVSNLTQNERNGQKGKNTEKNNRCLEYCLHVS